MGHSHATCAVSQLPIQMGERAVLVLLMKSPADLATDAGCYGGIGLWSPWAVPIPGIYNGYGLVTLKESWHTRFIQSRLDEVLVPRAEGTNPMRERPVSKKGIAADNTLEQLQKLIHDDRVRIFVDVDGEAISPLGRCLIREDIYRLLVTTPVFTQNTINTAKETVAKEMERMRTTETSPLHTGEMDEALKAVAGTIVESTVVETMKNLKHYMRLTEAVGSYGPIGYRGIGSYRINIAEQVMSGTPKDDSDLLDEVTVFGEFLHFLLHFEELRKLWTPQAGLGSQGTGWGSHTALANMIYAISRQAFEAETEKYEDPKPE